jgi:hypothetical protein
MVHSEMQNPGLLYFFHQIFIMLAHVVYKYTEICISWFTQPLTEMSTRNIKMFLGSKVQPVRWADNLTAICELIV